MTCLSLLARLCRLRFVVICFFLTLATSGGFSESQAQAATPPATAPKSIVVLASFDQALPWTQSFITGLTAERKRLNEQIDFFFEFIDQRRLGENVPEQMQADYLKAKYSGRKVDAVIIESRFAQKFVESQGEYIFGKVPYVLMSSVKGDRSKLAVSTQVTNVDWLPGNAALLKYMHPDAKGIVIVSGSSGVAKSIVGKLMPAFEEAFPALTIQQLTNLPLDELKLALAELSEGTIVLYTLYFRAPNGARYTPRDVAYDLAAVTSVPMYGLYRTYIGSGVVGGNMASPEQSAKDTLNATLRLIANGAAVPLRPRSVYSRVVMDARAMEKAGISKGQLPPGSEVLFEQPPFYKIYFVETVSLFSFMLVLIIALAVTLGLYLQKRRYSTALLQNKGMLELRVEQRTEALQQMALTDHLTGLPNRVAFYRTLQQQVKGSGCFVVAVMDIDSFKNINDRYGHPMGDRALQAFAQCCQQSLRPQDSIGRVGGEEFACVLPDTPFDTAVQILEQLCRDVASWKIPLDDGTQTQQTVSIGLVESSDQYRDGDALLQQADRQLYRAKRSGKNKVCYAASMEGLSDISTPDYFATGKGVTG